MERTSGSPFADSGRPSPCCDILLCWHLWNAVPVAPLYHPILLDYLAVRHLVHLRSGTEQSWRTTNRVYETSASLAVVRVTRDEVIF